MVKAFAARLRRIADRLDPPKPLLAKTLYKGTRPVYRYLCPVCGGWIANVPHIHIGDPNMSGTTTTSTWRFSNTIT